MKPGVAVEPKCPDPRRRSRRGPAPLCGCDLCAECGWPKHFSVHMGVLGPDGKEIPGMVYNHEYVPPKTSHLTLHGTTP